MTRNIALFDKIAAQIERDPESHDQMVFRSLSRKSACGSVHCIAGWAVVLSGRVDRERFANYETPDIGFVSAMAEDALGLNEDESDRLFCGTWEPPPGESVPDALRRIGRGGEINS